MDLWKWIGDARSLIWVDEAGVSRFDPDLVDLFAALLLDPQILDGGEARVGRHTNSSKTLYYDGDLMLVSATMAQGEHIRSHNHGAWNLTGVVRGSILYQPYKRLDDGTIPSYAELEKLPGEFLTAGHVGVCPPPPDDIHEVLGLADDTATVLLAPMFDSKRQYYYPHLNCYIESATTAPANGGDGR
jgi:predicted metal-dependent enzyme (double-stranded beta helix superfamily)